MEKLLLLDSNSLLHRAYYALPGLTDSKGNPTGAIFGFVSMLARLIKEEKPTHIAAAFDLKAPTFRHNMYAGYKATRKPMPEELVKQVPVLKKLIGALGIKIVELEGYEADDIIGTLAKDFVSYGYRHGRPRQPATYRRHHQRAFHEKGNHRSREIRQGKAF